MNALSTRQVAGVRPAQPLVSSRRLAVVVRADGKINTKGIRASEEKVADFVKAADLPKKAVFCRCWKSDKFPYCDGKHLAHNKDTGDNIGPLVIDSAPPAS